MKMVEHKAKPNLKQKPSPNLAWEDVKPVIEMIDSLEELVQATHDQQAFLDELAKRSAPIAKQWALAKVRSKLEEELKKLLDLVESPEEISKAAEDPQAFFDLMARKNQRLARACEQGRRGDGGPHVDEPFC